VGDPLEPFKSMVTVTDWLPWSTWPLLVPQATMSTHNVKKSTIALHLQ